MSHFVIDAVIREALAHALKHDLKTFYISFHGGEPLLAGIPVFEYFVTRAKAAFSSNGVKINFSVQTNGILIDEDWCDFFDKHDICVGISLDGDEEANDKNRVYHNGKGSYQDVVKGMTLLQNSGHNLKGGILSVIDSDADPVSLYMHYKNFGLIYLDLLFPDSNYEKPYKNYDWRNNTTYADWLIAFYDQWFYDHDEHKPMIRLFSNIMQGIMGNFQSSDFLGHQENHVLVIETDGSIEPVDVLKICGDGFTKQGMNITRNSIEDAFRKELIQLYYLSHLDLHPKCQSCPIKEICGGGYLPHRYSPDNGFNNPSIYCQDLIKLITHIRSRLVEKLSECLEEKAPFAEITYGDMLSIHA